MKGFIAAVVVALACAGCGKLSGERAEAANFVTGYCSVLQRVYAEANLELLAGVATEKEYRKVFPVIQALKATGNVMKTEVVSFKVKDATVTGDTATVRTEERWRYWWQERRSGAVTKPKTEEAYDLEYHLVKVKGKWRVDSIANLKP